MEQHSYEMGIQQHTTHYLYQNPFDATTEYIQHMSWRAGWEEAARKLYRDDYAHTD